ncbi:group I truncated hemoglobin [Pseudidiomarina andamanensis]|uniref:Group 1 truncated hemoglobin n=1 Tax=Pseudidiomarina andamanensis TaxID=1940690 RepID=A0AA92ERZ4_9GAMM|nr:group 1 truncated hemoglobin [Pseudidiomarina andamanensis]MDS0218000.1 group 1 truncated hemoglobin [Pseudidiomarina andamanensis]QGT94893.1 group 1 truncated hemoglobin [Pseudidiomarina andamanensis]
MIRAYLLGFIIMLALPANATERTLYDELGQQQGISQLMEAFILEIAEDERVIHHFENVDIDRFHRMLSEHICDLSGGPCDYSGESMVTVHTGMDISRAEFNAIVEHLMTAMDQQKLPVSTQNRLLAILASFHKEVIHQ